MINTLFPHIYVINLERRKDRRDEIHFMAEQQRWHRSYLLWPAVDALQLHINGQPMEENPRRQAELACKVSHARVIRDALLSDYEYILVLEDDAVIDIDGFDRLQQAFLEMEEVDPGWHMFYLGANDINDTKEQAGFACFRLFTAYTTHAYVIHRRAYLMALDALDLRGQADVLFAEYITSQGHSYTVFPYVATQREGISDITGANETYKLK